jgi:dTDP-4-amino-4,6-dideoxygalactose transaminase
MSSKSDTGSVPFLDLSRMHRPLLPEFEIGFRAVMSRSAFINGIEVADFEDAFARYVGTKYCLGTSSGYDALVLALRAAGLKPGERIIVPAMTFIATVEPVTLVGAVPVVVDVDPCGLMDLDQAEKALVDGTKFILPVHLFGQSINATRLRELAGHYGAVIIEDGCQAHGAMSGGVRVGAMGKASAFSFYPGKNLGALGDAGALCTDDESIYRKAKALREHGQTEKNTFLFAEGQTARLDTLQAAFLRIKLPHLDDYNRQRRAAAATYVAGLSNLQDLVIQAPTDDDGHVYHLFVVLSKRRQALARALTQRKIGFGFHYPVAIHQMPCYEGMPWFKASFPWAERYAAEGLSLPIFPGITEDEIVAVIDAVRSIHG